MYLVNLFSTSVNKNLDSTSIYKYKNIIKDNYCREIYYNYALLLVSLGDYNLAIEYLNYFETLLKKG